MADEQSVSVFINADTQGMIHAADEAVAHINRKLEEVQKNAQSGADSMGDAYKTALQDAARQIENIQLALKHLVEEVNVGNASLKEFSDLGNLKNLKGASASAEGLRELTGTFNTLKTAVGEVKSEFNSFVKENGEKLGMNTQQWKNSFEAIRTGLDHTGRSLGHLSEAAQNGMSRATDAVKEFEKHSGSLDKITAKVKSLAAAYLSFRGVKSLISGVMSATISQEGAERVLAGRVAATSGAAGFTAYDLKEQAKNLQDVTTYSDQAIMRMQSMVMIFKSIRGDNFTRATQAAMDLSTAIGGSLTTNAMRLGRALEDPLKGMGLLRRAGIVLSQSQNQLIKDFMKTGDIAKAQDVVLKQIEGTIGGAAKAYRNSLGGALAALRVKWNSLKEMNDRKAFGGLTDAVNDLIKALSSKQVDEFRKSLGDLVGGAIKGTISAMQTLADNVTGVKMAFSALMGMKIMSWTMDLIGYIGSLAAKFGSLSAALKAATASGAGWLAVAALIAAGASWSSDQKAKNLLKIQNEAGEAYKKDHGVLSQADMAKQTTEQLKQILRVNQVQKEQFESEIAELEAAKKFRDEIDVSGRQSEILAREKNDVDFKTYTKGQSADVEIARIKGRQAALAEETTYAETRLEQLKIAAAGGGSAGLNPQDYMKSGKTRSGKHGRTKSEVAQMMDKFNVLKDLSTQDAAQVAGEQLPTLEKLRDTLQPMSDDWRKVTATIEQCKEAVKKAKDEMFSNLAWDNQHGFLGDLEYYQKLRDEVGTLTQGTDEWKKRFSELSSIADRLIDKEYEKIYKEFENGKITLDEYEQKLKEVAELYGTGLPAVRKKALEDSNKMVEREKRNIYDLKSFTNDWISDLREGLTDALMDFNTLGDTLSNLGKQLERFALQMALFGQNGTGGLLGGLFGKLGNSMTEFFGNMFGMPSALGNVFDQHGLVKFANGGIVNKPTLFPFAKGTGLMGEAGPEAIMPLQRDSQGRLGVSVANNAQAAGNVTYAPVINVNVENNGSGDMSAQQANQMSRQVREVVDARIADQLSEYKRRGFFRAGGAYA